MHIPKTKTRLAITLDNDVLRRVDAVRSETGTTRSSIIAIALDEWLLRRKNAIDSDSAKK